jgi:crotonobetainyl-CoA:carnitine CoA-transferase CaiB-like acyl-CoA transferase
MQLARGVLSGRRVLEIGSELGMYCGKLLGDLGAEVIRIEPPGGDPARRHAPLWRGESGEAETSLSYLYLNTSKRSLMLDLESESGRDTFAALAREADLLVEALRPGELAGLGLGPELLCEQNPRLVFTSISGFGQDGPHANFAVSDLVISAMGSGMVVTGEAEDAPVALASNQAWAMASCCAAASSLIALHHARETGQGQRVDISAQEVMVAVTHICGVGKYLDDGIIAKRSGTGLFASVPSGAYPCKDGLIYLMVNRPLHWKSLAKWIHEVTGNEEVLLELFEGPSSSRIEYRELLDIYISDFTRDFDVETLYHEGQRRHIAMTPVNTVSALRDDTHLAERNFFVEVEQAGGGTLTMPGAPYRFAQNPWRIARPAPKPGNDVLSWPERDPNSEPARPDAASSQALAGVRVVEFTVGMAGPWIGRFMAHSGAEVIKIESQKHPGVVRLYVPPRERELGIQPAMSPWFTDWDAGKRFVSLDLSHPDAVAIAKQLVAKADVVIENNSTGVMEKLGLGHETLCEISPGLIHISTTGYGDQGPHARYVTWGSNIEAISGLSDLSGFPGRACTITQFAYPDSLSGLHGLVAVMAALDHRRRTGEGQRISIAQFETTMAAAGEDMMEPLASGVQPERQGNRSPWMAPHGCYPCAGDDRWCTISVEDDAAWQRLREALGDPSWARDPRFEQATGRLAHRDEVDEQLARHTRERDAAELMRALQEAGVAAGVAQNVDDLLNHDPHLAARGYFEKIPHRVKGSVLASGIPTGLCGTPGRTPGAGADFGQDNDYVLRELLGLSGEEIARFEESGAVERKT